VGPGEGEVELPGDRLLVLLRLPEALDAAVTALVAAALALLACKNQRLEQQRQNGQLGNTAVLQYK
jgi:hypothetical protein